MPSLKNVDSINGKTKTQSNTKQKKEQPSLTKLSLRWLAIILTTLALFTLLALSTYAIASRYDSSLRGLQFQNPIQSPLRFDQQETFLKAPQKVKNAPTSVSNAKHEPDSLEARICDVFGSQCETAIAVAKAESGLRCDAQNINKNGSIDLGIMQINSIHLKKGWKAKDLLDCDKNIELAYSIYKGSGWSAWSAYKNGTYKRHLAIN